MSLKESGNYTFVDSDEMMEFFKNRFCTLCVAAKNVEEIFFCC